MQELQRKSEMSYSGLSQNRLSQYRKPLNKKEDPRWGQDPRLGQEPRFLKDSLETPQREREREREAGFWVFLGGRERHRDSLKIP